MPPSPTKIVGAHYSHPPDARTIFLHYHMLCNDTSSVTRGYITSWWWWWGAQTEKIQNSLHSINENWDLFRLFPPSLVGAYYVQLQTHVPYFNNDLLCNDTCSVTGGVGAQTKEIRKIVLRQTSGSLSLVLSLLLNTWLQLPGAAQRSTAFDTSSNSLNISASCKSL